MTQSERDGQPLNVFRHILDWLELLLWLLVWLPLTLIEFAGVLCGSGYEWIRRSGK